MKSDQREISGYWDHPETRGKIIIARKNNAFKVEFTGPYVLENQKQIQLSTFKNQQKKVQQTERFIERFRAKNTKATQVQSRVKMLEKMELVDSPESNNKKIKLKFPEAPRSGRIVYEISKFSKEYKTGEKNINIVFESITFGGWKILNVEGLD